MEEIILNNNPVAKASQLKYNQATKEQQIKIDWLYDGAKIEDYQLKRIKRKRIKPKAGDVFVVTLDNENYFYGKVIKSDIKTKSGEDFYDGTNVIFIFKENYKNICIDNFKGSYDDLLIGPCLVSNSYWTSGYFFNICNVKLWQEEQNLNYGFWKTKWMPGQDGTLLDAGRYIKEDGTIISEKPKYFDLYAVTTDIGIGKRMVKELIYDSTILESFSLNINHKNIELNEFEKSLEPFSFEKKLRRIEVYLESGEYKRNLFELYGEDGIEGNGYDWEKIAKMFLKDSKPNLKNKIKFDSQADVFYAYSGDEDAMMNFITSFKYTCEDNSIKEYILRLKDN